MEEKYSKELEEIISAFQKCTIFSKNNIYEDMFYDIVDEFKDYYKGRYSFVTATGASKGVMIFEDLDLVIKIPFEGYIDEDDNEFYDFDGAENGWNYCEDEVEIYDCAKRNSLGDIFIETKLLTLVNDYPIYIQKYVNHTDCIYHNPYPASDVTKNKVTSYDEVYEIDISIEWLSSVFEYYGEEKFENLLQFVLDVHIDDLHSANIGWDNNRPVIFDYAGFSR